MTVATLKTASGILKRNDTFIRICIFLPYDTPVEKRCNRSRNHIHCKGEAAFFLKGKSHSLLSRVPQSFHIGKISKKRDPDASASKERNATIVV